MEDLLSSLNTQQAEAVKHVAGPILILAGAGSGKTKALTTRIAYLLEKGVPPYSILAITFTNKAAKEMRERVDKLVGPLAKDVWLYTFHGFCNQLLRREIKHLSHYGYGTGFSIYDTTDCKNVLKGILKDLKMDEKFYPLSAVMSVISNAKNAQLSSAAFARKADDFHAKKVAEIYLEYEKRMRQNNAVDFDDLLLLSVDLLQHDRDVREKYQHKFQYVMIDEYQDTNHVQYLLAKLISAPENNLCAVGDIDQSIYGWRGADISNILDFEKDYPDAKIYKLEQNYRSTQVILDAANAVIEHNSARRPKNLWTENGNGKPITYFQAFNDRNEAEFTVHNMRRLRDEAHFHLGDMAVLYRTNAQSRMFEETLIKNGLPYIMVGSLKFYDRKEVKDLLAYLRLLVNGRDEQALERVINEPKRGIGSATVEKLKMLLNETGLSLHEALKAPSAGELLGRSLLKVTAFSTLLESLRKETDTVPVEQLMTDILEKTGYWDALLLEGSEQARGRMDNLDELKRIAMEFQEDENEEEKTLEDFLNHVALVSDIDDAKLSRDAVTLMTLRESGVAAFFTRSSAANIPVNLEICRRLGLPESTYSISIPVGATINMAGAAITITVLTLSAAYSLNIPVDLGTAVFLSFVASICACGASGVPGGSLMLIPLACGLFGIDQNTAMQVVAVGFIIGVLQDSCETALNSSSDALFTIAACQRAERLERGE